jgi:hypothetical protein
MRFGAVFVSRVNCGTYVRRIAQHMYKINVQTSDSTLTRNGMKFCGDEDALCEFSVDADSPVRHWH